MVDQPERAGQTKFSREPADLPAGMYLLCGSTSDGLAGYPEDPAAEIVSV